MNTVNGPLTSSAYAAAMRGMSMARPIVIPLGQVIYRFYDMARAPTPAMGAAGAWWLEFESFQAIRHFAQRNGYQFSYAVRLFTAIPYEWSEVNAYVACQTVAPLFALKGRGKQVHSSGKDQRDRSSTMTPMQSVLEIYQLYVPKFDGVNGIATRAVRLQAHAIL